MKHQEYIETVVAKITDSNLKNRIREELTDHWEDYCENTPMTNTPNNVLGDETLLAYQTNAVTSPGMFGIDIVISALCGVFTFVLTLMFTSFIALDIGNSPLSSETILVITAGIIGMMFWSGIAWYMFLTLQRHLFIRYGQSFRKTFLLTIAIILPCIFSGIEIVLNFMHVLDTDAPAFASWQFFSSLLVILILLGLFLHTNWLSSRKTTNTDQILSKLHRHVPIIIAITVTVGAIVLITENDALALIGMPFTMPLLILYLFWGLGTNIIGLLFQTIGVPVIFAYSTTVLFALFIGVVIPTARLILRKQNPLIFQLIASIIFPLAIILPVVPSDIPNVRWNTPVVWSWDSLEQTQLNISYPWAAALMRRNDGINVGYSAYLTNGKITVVQDGGLSYVITSENTTTQKTRKNTALENDNDSYAEIPTGFTCDTRPLEDFVNTHANTTGPLGMFGIRCGALEYQGNEVATIESGSLIDLDISDDGLLAVSINMGSYDPTYVYVLDIRGDISRE